MGNTVISVDPNPENHVLLYNSLGKSKSWLLFYIASHTVIALPTIATAIVVYSFMF